MTPLQRVERALKELQSIRSHPLANARDPKLIAAVHHLALVANSFRNLVAMGEADMVAEQVRLANAWRSRKAVS